MSASPTACITKTASSYPVVRPSITPRNGNELAARFFRIWVVAAIAWVLAAGLLSGLPKATKTYWDFREVPTHTASDARAVKPAAPRLQQMKMLARPGHRHIEEPALLVDLLGPAACHIRRNTAVD
jgi:hypothetical protein